MTEDEPVLRVATPLDAPRCAALMRRSAEALFPRFYPEPLAASAVRHIPVLDQQLLADGTYFVVEADGAVVACGGWSRRGKLYTGSGDAEDDARDLDPASEPARVRAMFVHPEWTRRGLGRQILVACERAAARAAFRSLTLMATLPGVPLYLAYGFRARQEVQVPLPDGVRIAGVVMDKDIDRPDGVLVPSGVV
jgi:GNAT superfamily N-acetyltransferase